MGEIFIGTSGYNYKDWKGRFYPKDLSQKEWLSYYSQHFNTVEINATFYGSFKRIVFENWGKKVGEDFVFTIKGSRFITHIKRINDVKDEVDRFFKAATGLGEKLLVVLWQFPRSFKNNGENLGRLEKFLQRLSVYSSSEAHPQDVILGRSKATTPESDSGQARMTGSLQARTIFCRHAFEFRDTSWFTDEVFTLLDENHAGFVINDSPHFPSIKQITGGFAYIRFHGPAALYSSSYSDGELKTWAGKIKRYLKKYDVYAYFNNDVGGAAVLNAKTLQKLLAQ